jgi:hypothetical protein
MRPNIKCSKGHQKNFLDKLMSQQTAKQTIISHKLSEMKEAAALAEPSNDKSKMSNKFAIDSYS